MMPLVALHPAPAHTGTVPPAHAEVALTGGRLTAGVVRVGDTVRRPSQASSHFTSRLLSHIRSSAFEGVPRYLGRDEHGRDVLSYIPGWVPAKFQYFHDEQVHAFGVLLRGFHDATRGSALAGSSPVVCHHDAGPNNVVFQAGRPAAFIDFDLAAPGQPLDDVAYAAWLWCVSSKTATRSTQVQAAQVRLLADAYGLDRAGRRRIVDAMLERQSRNARFWSDRRDVRDGPVASLEQIEERIAWSERERAFTAAHRREFAAALR